MNREQRRALEKNNGNKKMTVVEDELDEMGKDFLLFAEENNVDLNAFFKMFSAWLSLPSTQKQAVILNGVGSGKIRPDETIKPKN